MGEQRDTIHEQLLLFELEAQRFALPLTAAERVERAVAITPLPNAPVSVIGVINVRGDLLPVISLRRRLGLRERALTLADQLLIARGSRRVYALLIDAVLDVIEYRTADVVAAQDLGASADALRGALRLVGDIVLIQDLERFLSLDEERVLAQALAHV